MMNIRTSVERQKFPLGVTPAIEFAHCEVVAVANRERLSGGTAPGIGTVAVLTENVCLVPTGPSSTGNLGMQAFDLHEGREIAQQCEGGIPANTPNGEGLVALNHGGIPGLLAVNHSAEGRHHPLHKVNARTADIDDKCKGAFVLQPESDRPLAVHDACKVKQVVSFVHHLSTKMIPLLESMPGKVQRLAGERPSNKPATSAPHAAMRDEIVQAPGKSGGHLLDDGDVPEDGRYFAVSPAMHAGLLKLDVFRRQEYVGQSSAEAAIKRAQVGMIANAPVYKSSLFNANPSTAAQSYSVFGHKEGVALIQQRKPTVHSQYDLLNLGVATIVDTLYQFIERLKAPSTLGGGVVR